MQQSNVEAKKPPVNANAGAANGKPALQNAMAKYSNALQKLQQKAQNLQNAATTAAQQAQISAMQTTLDSLTLEANGLDMAQSATGNEGGLALLNPALDSLQNAAVMLRTAIDNAAATINAAGGVGSPCSTPTLYETYAYFTTNATGEQLNKGVRVGIFDKIGMLNNYSGAWLMTAQSDPTTTTLLSTARLQPPTTGDGYAGCFELGFPNAHTLRGGYRLANGKPAAYWNAPAILQLNPTSGQPVETGGSALIGTDLTTKGAVYAGAGPGLKLWHEGGVGNARIDVQGSGDIVFNYESNRNVYIGSQTFGAPYANLTVAGEITALKGDLEAPNGSVNVKDNLAGTKLVA